MYVCLILENVFIILYCKHLLHLHIVLELRNKLKCMYICVDVSRSQMLTGDLEQINRTELAVIRYKYGLADSSKQHRPYFEIAF